ncbi:divergent polysaccharide deacetylase family protein [Thalassotalea maritima]|uniref:divergent polysaccharide deacetylase family protein n=1 Tax=Thalassotalea maritima TaxID=3242416 RepID=UPI0035281CB6
MRILFLLFCIFIADARAQQHSNKLAIVIDDIGYRASDRDTLALPKEVTLSVLPHTPFGRDLAILANAQQREVLLHVPMQSVYNLLLGPGALTSDMDEASVRKTLEASIADIPYVIGINNHMGSLLTQKFEPMSWTMRFLKEKQLFFLDSKTSANSQAQQVAQRQGVPSLHRHIFLDNKRNEAYIERQFYKMLEMSKQNQQTVAIAHPHPPTIRVLKRMLPLLQKHRIDLVSISELLPTQQYASQHSSAVPNTNDISVENRSDAVSPND